MSSTWTHAERARLYQDIADCLADEPSREWFVSALRDLERRRAPGELSKAHDALTRAFEIGRDSRLGNEQPRRRPHLLEQQGRRELIQRVLNILQLARLAEDCCLASSACTLAIVEEQQSEFIRVRAAQRLSELARALESATWTPYYAALGVALRELIEHDLEMIAV